MLNNFTVKKVAFGFYYIIIIILSMINYNELENLRFLYKYDKIIHFMQYFFLIFFFINIFHIKTNIKNFFVILFFIIVSSFLIEFVQSYIPGRDSNIIDTVYDIFGGVSAFLIFFGIRYVAKFKN